LEKFGNSVQNSPFSRSIVQNRRKNSVAAGWLRFINAVNAVSDSNAYLANLQRGAFLLQQRRHLEAIKFFEQAIADDPDNPQAYAELARCWNALPNGGHKAIRAIDRAISLAPLASAYFGLKGWILICQMRYRTALKVANQGISLNPLCAVSLNALANAYTMLNRWHKAEVACLRILEIDPGDEAGLNLLAQAQRHQGRLKDSRETVARLLALQPNDAFGQSNAGFSALAVGDHQRANEHFLESLRMDPHSDHARRGLLESLRTRIWILSLNRWLVSFVHQPATFGNVAMFVFMFLLCMTGLVYVAKWLDAWRPMAGMVVFGILVACVLFYIYLSGFVGVMGSFLLLFDPLGRHALTTQEKLKACIPPAFFIGVEVTMLQSGYAGRMLALLFGVLFVVAALAIEVPVIVERWRHRCERCLPESGNQPDIRGR
jgi:Tfp pilus assembly protein PilF